MEEDRFDQSHHVSTGVVTGTHDGHVDGLWGRERREGLEGIHLKNNNKKE